MAKPTSVRYTGKAVFFDDNQIKRAQSFSSSTDYSEERLLELANANVAEVIDNATVSATLECNGYGSISNWLSVLGQGLNNGTENRAITITDADFENAITDAKVQISADDSTLYGTEWLGGLFLTGFSLSYSVDGVATESFDFQGTNKRYFLNAYKDIDIYKADYYSGSALIVSGVNLTGRHMLILGEDGVVVSQTKTGGAISLNTYSAPDSIITATDENGSALSFESGKTYRVVVSGTGTTFSSLPSTPAGIGGMRRGMIVPFLKQQTPSSEGRTLRLQSVSIDGDLSREEQFQLGDKRPYFRKLTRPLEISVTVEALASDFEELAILSDNEGGFDAGTLNEIDIEDFVKTSVLEILFYKDEITHTFANELMRIKLINLSLSSDSADVSVGDNATTTFNFTCDNFLVSGSGVTPFI